MMQWSREGFIYFLIFIAVIAAYFVAKQQFSIGRGVFYAIAAIFGLGGLAFLTAAAFFILAAVATGNFAIGASEWRYLLQGLGLLAIGMVATQIGKRL
jgi:hypothetical protein